MEFPGLHNLTEVLCAVLLCSLPNGAGRCWAVGLVAWSLKQILLNRPTGAAAAFGLREKNKLSRLNSRKRGFCVGTT